eukprot:766691-Hanusia_phi.AAC.13
MPSVKSPAARNPSSRNAGQYPAYRIAFSTAARFRTRVATSAAMSATWLESIHNSHQESRSKIRQQSQAARALKKELSIFFATFAPDDFHKAEDYLQ